MEDREAGQGAFDERAALEELERLREEIERRRAAREAAAGRFDAFIGSFRRPPTAASVERAPATPSTPRTHVPPAPAETLPPRVDAVPPPVEPPPPAVEAAPPPAQTPLVESAPLDEPVPSADGPQPPSAAPRKSHVRTRTLVGSVLLLPALGAFGLWAWRQQLARADVAPPGAAVQRSADPPDTRASEPPIDRTTAPPAAPAEPARTPAATQLEIEITTTRSVWVRVLSDGERVLERELPAEARVPVTAKQTIVVRAGDAGAVRVSVGGREPEPIGAAGQPITRTFTAR
jgi:hypothetical protein